MNYTNVRDAGSVFDRNESWPGPSPQLLRENPGYCKKINRKSLDEYDGYKDEEDGYYSYATLSGYDRRPGLPSNRLYNEYEPEL